MKPFLPLFAFALASAKSKHEETIAGPVNLGIDSVAPISTCDNNYSLTATGCVRQELTHPNTSCEKGFEYKHGECVGRRYTNPAISCPPGSQMNGKRCERLDTTPSIPECGKGFQLKGTECIKQEAFPVDHQCPKSFQLDSGSLRGGSGGHAVCSRKVKCDGECPPGSIPDRGGCYTDEVAPPMTGCPKGYEVGEDRTCHKVEHHDHQLTCGRGYVLQDKMCVLETRENARMTCAEGTLTGRFCVVELRGPPIISCPKNYELLGSTCQRIDTAPVVVTCQKGYRLEGGDCVQREEINPVPMCPEGFSVDGRSCVSREMVAATKGCAEGYNYRDGSCERNHHKDAVMNCPKGYRLEGDSCINRVKVKSVACEDRVETVPAETVCRKGGEYDVASDQCLSVRAEFAYSKCPNGYRLSNSTGDCVSTAVVSAIAVCGDGATARNGRCEEILRSPSTVSCDKGYVLGPDGMCGRNITIPARLECPGGYRLHNGVCMTQNYINNGGKKGKK